MSSATEAQSIAHEIWPPNMTGSVQQSVWRMYRFMKPRVTDRPMTVRRAETIWQGNIPFLISQEMDALRAAQIEETIHEQKFLNARLATLNARLAVVDEAFHAESMAALSQQGRRPDGTEAELRGSDNAGDRG